MRLVVVNSDPLTPLFCAGFRKASALAASSAKVIHQGVHAHTLNQGERSDEVEKEICPPTDNLDTNSSAKKRLMPARSGRFLAANDRPQVDKKLDRVQLMS